MKYIPDTKTIIAVTIILIGFSIIEFGHLSDNNCNRIFDLMFLVATYYFGSSQGQSKKDELISTMAQKQ